MWLGVDEVVGLVMAAVHEEQPDDNRIAAFEVPILALGS